MLSLLVVRGMFLVAIACLSAVLAAALWSRAPSPLGPAVAHADPAQVLIVGDSIAVGLHPFLVKMITDREVTFDAKNGRTTPQGLRALRFELERYAPQAVVLNLGTNDGSDPDVFAERVAKALHAVPRSTCVVWPAIVRAPRKGAYKELNRVLRDAARRDHRLTVLNYDRMVAKGSVPLRDGVHPTHEGYRFLSWVTAAAVQRGC
ncbi:MAG TPA: SGNH/GDSL hydrolase family protein [Solirubrobacteraceae bacterium]|nr:SGNH/GDSL hydrolase family protein [Solirubrobacteraceae bacterium]